MHTLLRSALRPRVLIPLLAAFAGAGAMGLAQSSSWNGPTYEYAEFVYLGDDEGAVMITNDTQFKLPPPAVDPGQRRGSGNLTLQRLDLKLQLLNQVGSNGWRVVDAQTIEPGKRYLMIRGR